MKNFDEEYWYKLKTPDHPFQNDMCGGENAKILKIVIRQYYLVLK
jgi:hypothetical protein